MGISVTDEKIVATIREWFGDQDVANCVLESEQSIKDWLDRMKWHVETYDHRPPIDKSYLLDWYINSVSDEDDPVWTNEHIDELIKDFDIYAKRIDKMEGEQE